MSRTPRSTTPSPKDRRRWFAFGLAVALHLAILALFLSSHPPIALGAGQGEGMMDVSLAGLSRVAAQTPAPAAAPAAAKARAAPAAPEKPQPPVPAEPIKPRSVLAIVSEILAIPLPENSVTPTPLVAPPSPDTAQAMAQAGGSAGAACDIGGAVQTALRADPAAHGAVLLIPVKERSAADAVLLWNGQWIAPNRVGGAAVSESLRIATRQVIAAASPACRDRENVGPTFMLIPDRDSTMVIVFGNASWRWSDLLDNSEGSKSDQE